MTLEEAFSQDGVGYTCVYEYQVPLGSNSGPFADGIPHRVLIWCAENCSKRWGWFFKNGKPVLTFEDDEERTWFIMTQKD